MTSFWKGWVASSTTNYLHFSFLNMSKYVWICLVVFTLVTIEAPFFNTGHLVFYHPHPPFVLQRGRDGQCSSKVHPASINWFLSEVHWHFPVILTFPSFIAMTNFVQGVLIICILVWEWWVNVMLVCCSYLCPVNNTAQSIVVQRCC